MRLTTVAKTRTLFYSFNKPVIDKMHTLTVTETFYFPTWILSEQWANAERTLWEQRAHAEQKWMLVNGEWMQSANWVQMQMPYTIHVCVRHVNAKWTVYYQCLGSYPYIVFHVFYQEKIANKHVCIFISLNMLNKI